MSKYLIGIGCSFTSGQGSVPRKFHARYGDGVYKRAPIAMIDRVESDHSWVTNLADRIGYIPLNFGSKGRGNRSAAKELYMNQLDSTSEKIVVFCLSGLSRFDFLQPKGELVDHHFQPVFPDLSGNKLWQGYAEFGNSWQQEAVDCILNIAEVQNWCKVNNAKLLLVSAFDLRIGREEFRSMIIPESKKYLADIVDWDLMVKPKGNRTLMEYLVREQEPSLSEDELQPIYSNEYFNRYKIPGFAEGLITPCGHPSNQGHIHISSLLEDEIIRRGYVTQGK